MNYQWMPLAANLCFGLMIIYPIYFVIFRGRFWFSFFAAWFFIVAQSHFSVYHGLYLLDQGLVDSASDTTSIGLTMFTGWILVLPYCLILALIRKSLRQDDVQQQTETEKERTTQI